MPTVVPNPLSGRDTLEHMIAGGLPAPTMARKLNFTLVETGDGLAVFTGTPDGSMLNPFGSVHGGWALTIIDSATACAALSTLPAGMNCTTVSTQANFVRPIMATTGLVRCEARVLARGRTIITADAKLTDTDGRLLAHGNSTLSVFPTK